MAQNIPNATVFLDNYSEYENLQNGNEFDEVSLFIHQSKDMEIEHIAARMEDIRNTRMDIEMLDKDCCLGLFYIDCTQLNENLSDTTRK